jgi:signal transduction histidine kinase/CheY-like chemotaxis protein/HPt (histidine-containing phosphotransfer) domain-containing protein
MARLGVRYLIFWLFLAGICIIVFFQVISGHNTNRLISGNRNLLAELSYQKEIRRLEADVLTIESDIRGAVITQDSSHLTNIQNKIQTVQTGLDSLKKHIGTRSSYNLDLLSGLVQEKINFSYKILIAFKQEGKAAAEVVVNTNRGKILRDSIVMITSGIDSVRQAELQKIYGGIEKTGKRARVWGFVFSGFALLLVVFAFVYILNKGRQQTRMIEALNEAEKRNREAAILKEQFLANMSHEIRTPINAILGFTNLLKRTDLNSDQKQFVRNINSSGENLLVIINDILDLSKIESGMIHFEKNEFSLRSLISSVSSMFSEKTRQKKLHLFDKVDEAVPDHLLGDPVRLTQILNNLLSNAVKFTERGIISLEVNTVTVRKNKARLQFIVADTGIGISPDKQQSIFERFQQAEAETTRRYGGTGLGLSIVRELVERQGGDIRLESEQGKGSKFFIELEYEVLGQQSGPQENVQPEILEGRIDQARLLIAEDNYMNQQLIEFLMRKWNIDYDLVGNGNEAVEAVKRNEYSLILMDIQMPEMDGYNATEIIRKEVGSEVPIIAMTAHAMAGEKEKCIRLGMNDYISKPIKEQLLHDLILQHALQNVEVPDGEKLINLNYLHELSGNDPEFEKQILQQFVIQTPKELSDLQNAIEKGDALQVKRIAHSLKSTVGYVGMAEQLHPALERLEKWSENGSGLNDFQLVKARCSKAFAEVQQLLNSNQ